MKSRATASIPSNLKMIRSCIRSTVFIAASFKNLRLPALLNLAPVRFIPACVPTSISNAMDFGETYQPDSKPAALFTSNERINFYYRGIDRSNHRSLGLDLCASDATVAGCKWDGGDGQSNSVRHSCDGCSSRNGCKPSQCRPSKVQCLDRFGGRVKVDPSLAAR